MYIQMFLSYMLYVCIILETAHHRATLRIFCSITQKTTSEENSHKMFHISSAIVLFSYGKVKDVFWIWIKFHLGRAKGRGKREVWGSRPNEVGFFFCKKFPLLSEIQTLSHKLLVRQTSNHPHHCNQYTQKPLCRDFQVISSSYSWSKTALCILRNKYG